MNKKQKNRKLVLQNQRNRIINRRYLSTIKTLSKLIKAQHLIEKNEKENKNKGIEKVKTENTILFSKKQKLLSAFYSIVDKAVKKKVIHKNTAARKKSKLSK
jgi:small subunit ribosomal protein S20